MIEGMSARDARLTWGTLLKHPAWKELEKLCDTACSAKAGEGLQPVSTQEDIARHNVVAGEIQGIHFVLGMPQTMIEACETTISQENKESGNVDETE